VTDKNKHAAAQPASTAGDDVASANSPQALRRQAEARLLKKAAPTPENIESLSPEETRTMLHELHVHQIELEMQNEELRDAQVALGFEQARYFDLYDLAPIGYCTVSEHGLIKQANLTAAGLLGTTRSELLKQRWTRYIHKEDVDLYYLHRKKLVESGEPQSCELRMMKNDGTQFWGHWAATVSHDGNGKLELRAVLSDITERKRTEVVTTRLAAIVDSSDDAVISKDLRGIVVSWNRGAEKLFGYPASEIIGKSVTLLIPFERREEETEILGKIVRGEGVQPFDTVRRQKDGSTIDVNITVSPIKDEVGRIVGASKVARDVTGRKRLERMLQENNAALERARSAADKANRAKSEFLSSMSHELRTPLNAILGFAQLIEAGSPTPTPTQKRNVDHILKAGWYLLALVDEILDLAVIESGTLSLSMEAVSLDEVMRECQAMVEPQAQSREIRMSFPRFDAPCYINADRNRVKQVLSNLLSNAIKYNRPDGSVDVDWVVSTAGRIRISVGDTGDGLSPGRLAQLFQPFNRLGKETGTEQGTGIGLVVSKRVVEMMDGAIGVESTVGKGSVFWVELNLTTDPQPVAGAAQAAADALAPSQIDRPLRTLLYVEDNPANLMLVEEIISRRPDIRLLTAMDGDRGIEIARAVLPDVILMDINLPGISGVDAIKILAEDPATARIPVVALSANAIASDIEYGLREGFFRYLTKPIKINEFMDTLDIALEFSLSEASRTKKKEQA
jgi:PAS domain S-box-containing protein